MNNIQGGHVTCYICEVQALAPQFSNSPWTGTCGVFSKSGWRIITGAGHMPASDLAFPIRSPATSKANPADTRFRSIIMWCPRRFWADSITNTVWKGLQLDPKVVPLRKSRGRVC